MDLFPLFMSEVYMAKPDSRIPAKEIYEDFRAWVIGNKGMPMWNNISQKEVYDAMRSLPIYAYARFREGNCLKGIAYKVPKLKEDIFGETAPQTYLTLEIARPAVQPTLTLAILTDKYKSTAPRVPHIVIPAIGRKD
jgi:hypothetical protein